MQGGILIVRQGDDGKERERERGEYIARIKDRMIVRREGGSEKGKEGMRGGCENGKKRVERRVKEKEQC